jgi:hypothetical protein
MNHHSWFFFPLTSEGEKYGKKQHFKAGNMRQVKDRERERERTRWEENRKRNGKLRLAEM